MLVYNRKTKEVYEELQSGYKWLKFLYHTAFGRMILKLLISPKISKLYGRYNDSKLSKYKINKWVKKYNLDLSIFEKNNYDNFNDFFARKLKSSKLKMNTNDLVAPAESKLMVYRVDKNLKLKIKESHYDLDELFSNQLDLSQYSNGLVLVYYLTVDCYHRYAHIDSGNIIKTSEITGVLHTVNPIASKEKVYSRNHRIFSMIDGQTFGKYVQMEVGAMMVGKIVNHSRRKFKKGDEKGYFKLGASTVVILLKDKTVTIDEDILENSANDIATRVDYLEVVGKKL